jgi:hypothetical protein
VTSVLRVINEVALSGCIIFAWLVVDSAAEVHESSVVVERPVRPEKTDSGTIARVRCIHMNAGVKFYHLKCMIAPRPNEPHRKNSLVFELYLLNSMIRGLMILSELYMWPFAVLMYWPARLSLLTAWVETPSE